MNIFRQTEKFFADKVKYVLVWFILLLITHLNWCIWTCIIILGWIRNLHQDLISNNLPTRYRYGRPNKTTILALHLTRETHTWCRLSRCHIQNYKWNNQMSMIMVAKAMFTSSQYKEGHLVPIMTTAAMRRRVQQNQCNWIKTRQLFSTRKFRGTIITRHRRSLAPQEYSIIIGQRRSNRTTITITTIKTTTVSQRGLTSSANLEKAITTLIATIWLQIWQIIAHSLQLQTSITFQNTTKSNSFRLIPVTHLIVKLPK